MTRLLRAGGRVRQVKVELNALVFRTAARQLRKAPPKDRQVRMNGDLIDLGLSREHHSLGTIQLLSEKGWAFYQLSNKPFDTACTT